MSDTSNAPSTASGLDFMDDLDAIGALDGAAGDNRPAFIARIRDIEDEARAMGAEAIVYGAKEQAAQLQEADTQLLTLREAVEHHTRNHPKECGCGLHAALNSTAEYNKQALARIREEVEKPWYTMVGRLASYLRSGERLNVQDEADIDSLLASQSKSDTE